MPPALAGADPVGVAGGVLRSTLPALITELSSGRTGIPFVYWCLERVGDALDIDDAVLVLDHPVLGRQAFRLGGRPVGPDVAALLQDEAPALHLDADVAAADAAAVARLCLLALNLAMADHDASHDAMTGLLNRRAFDDALTAATAQSARHGWPFALLVIDIDDFKLVNDEHGHLEGDRTLEALGAELRRSLRSGDRAARLGGDEFGVILAAGSQASADALAKRLAAGVEARVGRPIRMSTGVATAPGDATDPEMLYKIADVRLYEAKRR